jgi:hypothetical protein
MKILSNGTIFNRKGMNRSITIILFLGLVALCMGMAPAMVKDAIITPPDGKIDIIEPDGIIIIIL